MCDTRWTGAENQQEWRQDTVKKPTDVISWLLKAIDDHDPSAPPGDGALYDEGRLAIVAGRSVQSLHAKTTNSQLTSPVIQPERP